MSQKTAASLSSTTSLLLELSDDRLVLGHRLSEWCGVGPTLEEDIALANIALDLLGHANNGLSIVADAYGSGVTADSLAFLRDAVDFRNIQLVEQPNGDFAQTILRQYLFDAYSVLLLEILSDEKNHGDSNLAGWAAKCHKEDLYHLRHSSQWVLRLGDGTSESNHRAQAALNDLWRFTPEMQTPSENLKSALGKNGAKLAAVGESWRSMVTRTISEATLQLPKDIKTFGNGGRSGQHTEHLSVLLATMQVLPRAHPGAQW